MALVAYPGRAEEPLLDFVQRKGGERVSVSDYGALRGNRITDGAMTSGSAALTSAAGLFTAENATAGMVVTVPGAGTAAAILRTTVAAYVSATEITLTDAAGTTVSDKHCYWGPDNAAAVQAAHNSAIGKGTTLHWPRGYWLVTAAPIIAEMYANWHGEEGSWIVYVGAPSSGAVLEIDGRSLVTVNSLVCALEGSLSLDANGLCNYGLRCRVVARSRFGKIRVRNAISVGWHNGFFVQNRVEEYCCSVNELGNMWVKPEIGLEETNVNDPTLPIPFNNPAITHSTDNKWGHVNIEGLQTGVGIGIKMTSGQGDHFYTGGCQGNNIAVWIEAGSSHHNFFGGFIFEANVTWDILCKGFACKFFGLKAATGAGVNFTPQSYLNTMIGGYYKTITNEAGATGNVFRDLKVETSFSDSGTSSESVNVWLNDPGYWITDKKSHPMQWNKNSTYNNESTAAIGLVSGSASTKLALGADDTATVGFLQAMQEGTSWMNRALSLQPNGGSVLVNSVQKLGTALQVVKNSLYDNESAAAVAICSAELDAVTKGPQMLLIADYASNRTAIQSHRQLSGYTTIPLCLQPNGGRVVVGGIVDDTNVRINVHGVIKAAGAVTSVTIVPDKDNQRANIQSNYVLCLQADGNKLAIGGLSTDDDMLVNINGGGIAGTTAKFTSVTASRPLKVGATKIVESGKIDLASSDDIAASGVAPGALLTWLTNKVGGFSPTGTGFLSVVSGAVQQAAAKVRLDNQDDVTHNLNQGNVCVIGSFGTLTEITDANLVTQIESEMVTALLASSTFLTGMQNALQAGMAAYVVANVNVSITDPTHGHTITDPDTADPTNTGVTAALV